MSEAQQFIQHACGLARLVQPALIVMEDVDLVAESRHMRHGMDNPLLFQVLNEMDGISHVQAALAELQASRDAIAAVSSIGGANPFGG